MPLRYLIGLSAGALALASAVMSGPERAAPYGAGERADRAPRARNGPFVVDGDTIDLNGERVRIWGIDAPDRPRRMKEAARKRAVSLIAAEGITCETGTLANMRLRATNFCPSDLTSYGRTNAKCTLHKSGEDFGERMVREGFAVEHRRFDCGAYSSTMSKARSRRAGLWGSESREMSELAMRRQANSTR